MALQSTLKRNQPSSNNDGFSDEDDDEDVTWGGKRPRHIYNFVLADSSMSCVNDSDETESVRSIQSKSTIPMLSEGDRSDESSGSSANGRYSSYSNVTEFDVRSLSSSSHNVDSSISDTSTTIEFTAEEFAICEALLSDNGYAPDNDTDTQNPNRKPKLPPPLCFKNCLQCGEKNSNPYFQYCYTCYRNRKEYFEDKPDPSRKKKKLLIPATKKEEELSPTSSQEPSSLPNSQESTSTSTSFGLSALFLSQKANSKGVDTSSTVEINENDKSLCDVCHKMPKNGAFNHKKISHIYSCYKCAKELWKKNNKRCPYCNVKVRFVTKMITV